MPAETRTSRHALGDGTPYEVVLEVNQDHAWRDGRVIVHASVRLSGRTLYVGKAFTETAVADMTAAAHARAAAVHASGQDPPALDTSLWR